MQPISVAKKPFFLLGMCLIIQLSFAGVTTAGPPGGVPAPIWTIFGNSNTDAAQDFLGTIDAQDLVLKTNNLERLTIRKTGEVDVKGDVAIGNDLFVANRLDVDGNLTVEGFIAVAGDVVHPSDVRLKKDISTLSNALVGVMQLRGVGFRWKDEDKDAEMRPQVGVIAQEVERIFPELVVTNSKGYKAVAYSKLTPVLIEAVKELKAEKDALEARLAALEQRLGSQGSPMQSTTFGLSIGWPLIGGFLLLGLGLGRRRKQQRA